MAEPRRDRGTWLSSSRVALVAGGVVLLAGSLLVVHALRAETAAPRPRLGGLVLMFVGAFLVLAPERIWADLRHAARAVRWRSERWHLLALLVVVAAGAAVRGEFLGLPMRYDESTTFLTFASQRVSAALWSYPFPNNHMFNTLLM